jgi:hypothetical protein
METSMSNLPSPVSRFQGYRKLWKPALATGTGGAAFAIWFEEIITFVAEFIGVLFLPLLAGLIYLFNHYVFKSTAPNIEDIQKK